MAYESNSQDAWLKCQQDSHTSFYVFLQKAEALPRASRRCRLGCAGPVTHSCSCIGAHLDCSKITKLGRDVYMRNAVDKEASKDLVNVVVLMRPSSQAVALRALVR